MVSRDLAQLERLEIIGPISVERVDRTTTPSWRIMLMGIVGTGKSTFIESFADDRSNTVEISGGSLEGVTQEIVSYKLVNVVDKLNHNRLVYLVDTPGFADATITEVQIIKMAQEWLMSEKLLGVNRILYFSAITDVRLAGSKRRTLELFKAVAGEKAAEVVIFVTTMWDNILSSNQVAQKRALDRYKELQENDWKGFINKGAHVVKFKNEQKSSLAILDEVCNIRVSGSKWFEFEEMQRYREDIKDTAFGKSAFFSLLDRRSIHIMDLRRIEDDLQDSILFEFAGVALRLERMRIRSRLKVVEKQLEDFGRVDPAWEEEWRDSPSSGAGTVPSSDEQSSNLP